MQQQDGRVAPAPAVTSVGHTFVSKIQLCDATCSCRCQCNQKVENAKSRCVDRASLRAERAARFTCSLRANGIVRMTEPHLHKAKQHKDVEEQKTNVLST